ncbi:DUF2568 domain-containing protein [Nocardioides aestuarii]|uniref:DUF2568 domain-containing protein n=1 Tax=Nocardioides aestuarii TaxID=252231 RepID=A0ABW4TLI0_9ACTN
MGWTVLALVFLDEVLAVVALGYAWGLLAAVVGVAVWGIFASPKAPLGNAVTRPVAKVVVFGAASAGLWLAGHEVLAVALLVFSVVVNALALLPGVRALAVGATG